MAILTTTTTITCNTCNHNRRLFVLMCIMSFVSLWSNTTTTIRLLQHHEQQQDDNTNSNGSSNDNNHHQYNMDLPFIQQPQLKSRRKQQLLLNIDTLEHQQPPTILWSSSSPSSSPKGSDNTTTNTTTTAPTTATTTTNATTTTTPTPTTLSMIQNMINQSTLDIPIELYQNKTSPVKDLLKVYVYDTLPPHLSTDLMDDVIRHAHDSNHVTDITLIKLFQTFPGRTHDPNQADIFVVPYPHITHCFHTVAYKLNCGNLRMEDTTSVFQYLQYYNKTTAHKHLMLLADGEYQAHRWLLKKPLLTMYGPRWEDNTYRDRSESPSGHIIIPQFNSRPDFQPSIVLHKLQQQLHQQKPKRYSLSFVAGAVNRIMGKNSARRFRKYFFEELQQRTNISGLPFVTGDQLLSLSGGGGPTTANELYENYYPNSILCPILPGDTTWQRRFFDVMACGCLPVVISYPLKPNSKRGNRTSWFLPEPTTSKHTVHRHVWSVEETYPFTDIIDYRSFVVECPGNHTHPEDMSHIIPTCIEDLITNHPDIIQQKQEALRKVVLKVLYGVGPDAHRYDDAFAQLIRSLRHYLDNYSTNKRAERIRKRKRRRRQRRQQQQ